MADIAVEKQVFVVFREQHSGAWQEIYRTPDKDAADLDAERQKSWDARTKVVEKTITVFEEV